MPFKGGSPSFHPGGVGYENPEISGTIAIDSELELGEVSGCQGETGVYGVELTSSDKTLTLISNKSDGPGNVSTRVIADVNVANLDNDHVAFRVSWKDSNDTCTPLWDTFQYKFKSYESSSFEVLGNEADSEDTVGAYIGSSVELSSSGAKIVSEVNGEFERGYTDASGSKVLHISDFGGYATDQYWSELVVPLSGSYTDTELTIPAGAVVYGVGVRVVNRVPISASEFPTTGTFGVGISSSAGFTEKWGDGMFADPGVTNFTSSMKDGFTYYGEDTPIRLRFSPVVSDQSASFGSGSIRVECHYRMVIPPQE